MNAGSPSSKPIFIHRAANKKLARRLLHDYKTPLLAHQRRRFCLGSSMVEQLTLNQLVEGSSPSRGTIFSCVSMRKKPFGGVGFYWGVNFDMVQYFTQTPREISYDVKGVSSPLNQVKR